MCVDRKPTTAQKLNHIPEAAAAGSNLLWKPGRTLRIAFAGGTRAGRAVVMQAAAKWSKFANITFKEVATDPAEVRCSFVPGGSWSYLGTEILTIPPDQPTMNIGWGPDLPTCLHELGHTLGLIHEHQNPAAGIPWDQPKVFAYYSGPPNYWPPSETYANVITPYSGPLTNGGYDRNSIMEYPIDAALLTDPSFAVGWNQDLSAKDIHFIQKIYPGRAIFPLPGIAIAADPGTQASVGVPGDGASGPVVGTAAPVLLSPTAPKGVNMFNLISILTSVESVLADAFNSIDAKVNFTAIEQCVVNAYFKGGVDAIPEALLDAAPTFAEDPNDQAIVAAIFDVFPSLVAILNPK
jgi:hypothetical protein